MENILPIIFLILYLVLTGMSKRRKASQDSPATPGAPERKKGPSPLRSILDAIAEEQERSKEARPEPPPQIQQLSGP